MIVLFTYCYTLHDDDQESWNAHYSWADDNCIEPQYTYQTGVKLCVADIVPRSGVYLYPTERKCIRNLFRQHGSELSNPQNEILSNVDP